MFDHSSDFMLGKANSVLHYDHGVLRLSYLDGTPYNDEAHTPRKVDLIFSCDQNASAGTPEKVTHIGKLVK